MTSHYFTLQDEEVKEIYSDMIFGKDSKIAGLRAKEIKATLYNNDIIKERILSLRAIEKGVPTDIIIATPKDKIKAKDDKIKQLYEEIRKLKEDKQNLIIQLVDMEELKDKNKRLREQLDKLKSMG